ncbi:hypothetical protein FOZ60_013258 [Perkinsus olseni]|uniref:Uncharacterized protein n=1 Tax=Perkinsus olseni TaxID=32597 RepID=A0A7J6N9J4_PEROL|nr:hypothetical protein FOZ60_013258 [Perkinsus olseni]
MVDNLDKAITKVVEVVSEGRILKPEEVLAMVEDVDYYADAESMVSISIIEEAYKNGMDFAVRCMAADKAITKVVEVVSEGRILKPEEVLAMVEDVDYYADAESMVSISIIEEAYKNGMDFAVRCMAAGIKVDAPGKQSNPAIEDFIEILLEILF